LVLWNEQGVLDGKEICLAQVPCLPGMQLAGQILARYSSLVRLKVTGPEQLQFSWCVD